jgi:hypothetical protein
MRVGKRRNAKGHQRGRRVAESAEARPDLEWSREIDFSIFGICDRPELISRANRSEWCLAPRRHVIEH